MMHGKMIPSKWFAAGSIAVALSAGLAICLAADKSADENARAAIKTGVDSSLRGQQFFSADDPWNQDISKEPVDPNSDRLIASIGLKKPLHPDFGALAAMASPRAFPTSSSRAISRR